MLWGGDCKRRLRRRSTSGRLLNRGLGLAVPTWQTPLLCVHAARTWLPNAQAQSEQASMSRYRGASGTRVCPA